MMNMKEFDFKEYIEEKEFNELIEQVLLNSDSSKVLPFLNALDAYISKKVGIHNSKIDFIGMEKGNEGHFDYDYFIQIKDIYLSCCDNLTLLEIYFHEKRHQFQYECFLKKNNLVDKAIFDEYDDLISPKNFCVISKKKSFNQLYGYYGMSMEQDAYKFSYKVMLFLLDEKKGLWREEERNSLVAGYKRKIRALYDDEFIYLVELHQKKFEIRKVVEQDILKKFKEAVRTGVWERDLKKLVFSKRLYDCLNEEERETLKSFFVCTKDSQINESERFLDKMIDKEMKKNMKQKKSFLGVI